MPKYETPCFTCGSASLAKRYLSSNPLRLKCRNLSTTGPGPLVAQAAGPDRSMVPNGFPMSGKGAVEAGKPLIYNLIKRFSGFGILNRQRLSAASVCPGHPSDELADEGCHAHRGSVGDESRILVRRVSQRQRRSVVGCRSLRRARRRPATYSLQTHTDSMHDGLLAVALLVLLDYFGARGTWGSGRHVALRCEPTVLAGR